MYHDFRYRKSTEICVLLFSTFSVLLFYHLYKPRKTESKLLIYQKYVDLIEYSYNLLIKYPKHEKYALVLEIRRTMHNSLRYILYANKLSDKFSRIKILGRLDAEIAMMSFFVRFSYKNRYINSNNYYTWSKKIEEIGRILGGWIKSCLKE